MKTLLITMLAVLLLAGMTSGCITNGHGSHVGYITASECSGTLRTVCSLYLKTDTQSTQEDKYCVDNERGDFRELWAQIQDAQRRKVHVEVFHHSEFAVAMSRCGPDVIIDRIVLAP